jgi:hypothetical protein
VTTRTIGQFFFRRPFVGFDIYLVDGRVVRVPHPETASLGEHATSVTVFESDGRLEIVDTALIVSCRTHQAVFDDA